MIIHPNKEKTKNMFISHGCPCTILADIKYKHRPVIYTCL